MNHITSDSPNAMDVLMEANQSGRISTMNEIANVTTRVFNNSLPRDVTRHEANAHSNAHKGTVWCGVIRSG